MEIEIRDRIMKGRSMIRMLNGFLRDKQIFKTTKINIYKSLVLSVITYGAEVWVLNSTFKYKLESTEMDFLRRSVRCSKLDKVRNEDIRKNMDCQNSIVDCIHNKQLTWYGHVRRTEEDRPQILKWIPAGRKRKGRPRTTWIEEVTKAMEHKGLTEEDCRDRTEWRRKLWAQEDA
ncbi:uncharacterized protein LOC111630653 [Centruroides sculpturatus]|uniref:uncharacterized protein LOC111630653 n=1 Tax=Centruroides sculpturatus TaxID=218467 RepID=UPI000C6D6D24|nr:uncharacterized protein LOC111630653 [Centruroides sculpturatus]